jgi:hypothetical protein
MSLSFREAERPALIVGQAILPAAAFQAAPSDHERAFVLEKAG